jgi:hypothetical protein
MLPLFQRWLHASPPVLATPPTYWQLRRYCRWQARELRRAAREARGDAAWQTRAVAQAAWAEDVLRHHPLLDDLQRTLQQSADLLCARAADKIEVST